MDNNGIFTGAEHSLILIMLFDKEYIASTHNYGVRPNKPQTVMAGISTRFLKSNKFYIVLR